jgi:hypothetical protein
LSGIGGDTDFIMEGVKYIILLLSYYIGIIVNYALIKLSKIWSNKDFNMQFNAISDFYNLFYFILFAINLFFGKIEIKNSNQIDLHLVIFLITYILTGFYFFFMMRYRKMTIDTFTFTFFWWVCLALMTINLVTLNVLVYQ